MKIIYKLFILQTRCQLAHGPVPVRSSAALFWTTGRKRAQWRHLAFVTKWTWSILWACTLIWKEPKVSGTGGGGTLWGLSRDKHTTEYTNTWYEWTRGTHWAEGGRIKRPRCAPGATWRSGSCSRHSGTERGRGRGGGGGASGKSESNQTIFFKAVNYWSFVITRPGF